MNWLRVFRSPDAAYLGYGGGHEWLTRAPSEKCVARWGSAYDTMRRRSYWIPGAYAPTLSEKRNSFLRLLKKKGFKEESMTKVGLYAIGTSTTLESNKSACQSYDAS